MKICVFGLWHLGCVTAACLADLGFKVTGLDTNQSTIDQLSQGKSPVFEKGLEEMMAAHIRMGQLTFTTNVAEAIRDSDAIWVTYDTPVDDDDNADEQFVEQQIKLLLEQLHHEAMIIISSQVPVGFTSRMERFSKDMNPDLEIIYCYSPENLRLGNAIHIFKNPDRIIIGARDEGKDRLSRIFGRISDRLEWMSIESAEMTKHAINSFLALSVTFANELACLCEKVGANAKDVERGLKTEQRIGPKAYLSPGAAFAGGTLARDAVFLSQLAQEQKVQTSVIHAIKQSNDHHKNWPRRKSHQQHIGYITHNDDNRVRS